MSEVSNELNETIRQAVDGIQRLQCQPGQLHVLHLPPLSSELYRATTDTIGLVWKQAGNGAALLILRDGCSLKEVTEQEMAAQGWVPKREQRGREWL